MTNLDLALLETVTGGNGDREQRNHCWSLEAQAAGAARRGDKQRANDIVGAADRCWQELGVTPPLFGQYK